MSLWMLVPVFLGVVATVLGNRAGTEGAALYLVAGIIASLGIPLITHLNPAASIAPTTPLEQDYIRGAESLDH